MTSKKYERQMVKHLLGSPKKANEKLNWKPEVSFDSLVKMMVESDLESAERKCS